MIAEVTNIPWRERHAYVVERNGSGPIRGRLAKRLHVSPFMPMEQAYDWRITEPGDALHVRIASVEKGQAGSSTQRSPCEDESSRRALMTRVLLTYPPMSLAVPAPDLRKRAASEAQGSALSPPPTGREPAAVATSYRSDTEARGAMIERAARAAARPRCAGADAQRPLDLREEWSGERLSFGPEDAGLRAAITVRSPDVYRKLARQRSVGLGQAYAEGLWDADDLVTLFRIGARELRRSDRVRSRLAPLLRPLQRLATLPVLNTRRGARRNIAAHYDLGNEMFELFLDREWMMYSSALFERAGRNARGGPASQARADLPGARAGARPAPVGDRDRLGRAGALRGLALRLPRDHDHHLARAARVRGGTDPRRRPRGAGPGPRRRLPGAHRQLRQAGVDRDDRGGRVGVLRHVLRALLGAAGAPRPDVPAGNRDRRPRLRGRKERPELLEHADLPRRLACPRSARSSARSRAGRTCAPSCSRTSARATCSPCAIGVSAFGRHRSSSPSSATTSAFAASGRCTSRSRRLGFARHACATCNSSTRSRRGRGRPRTPCRSAPLARVTTRVWQRTMSSSCRSRRRRRCHRGHDVGGSATESTSAAFGSGYDDVELLGKLVTRRRLVADRRPCPPPRQWGSVRSHLCPRSLAPAAPRLGARAAHGAGGELRPLATCQIDRPPPPRVGTSSSHRPATVAR